MVIIIVVTCNNVYLLIQYAMKLLGVFSKFINFNCVRVFAIKTRMNHPRFSAYFTSCVGVKVIVREQDGVHN